MGIKVYVQDVKEGKGGWRNVIANGVEYGLPPGKGDVEVGKEYEFDTISKESNGKRRLFIGAINPVGNADKTSGTSAQYEKREASVQKIADLKNKSIEQASVLKAKCTGWEVATAMAVAASFHGVTFSLGITKKSNGKRGKRPKANGTQKSQDLSSQAAYELLVAIQSNEYRRFLEAMGLAEPASKPDPEPTTTPPIDEERKKDHDELRKQEATEKDDIFDLP